MTTTVGAVGARRRPGYSLSASAVALPVLVVAGYVVAGWLRRFACDDAYINYRVVKQILAGHGPVFNTGERVEVTTSTLWLAALTVADVVSPLRLERTAILLELALGAAGVGLAMAGSLRLARLRRPYATGGAIPVGAVTYLGVAGAWDWATGGLENGLGLAWIGGSFWAATAVVGSPAPTRRRFVSTAVLVGLGVLVRPDFVVLCAGFGVPVAVVAWRDGRRRRLSTVVAAALAVPAAVQIFRMGYYGQLFPNTVYAKEAGRSWWSQGWTYLDDFATTYVVVIPVLALLAWLVVVGRGTAGSQGLAGWRLVVCSVEVAALAHVAGIVRVGGDYMHARLLLPAWCALLLPVFAVPVDDLRNRWSALAAGVMVAWAVVAAGTFRAPWGSLATEAARAHVPDAALPAQDLTGVIDQRAWTVEATRVDHPILATDHDDDIGLVEDWYPDPPVLGWFDPYAYRPEDGQGVPVSPAAGRTVMPLYGIGATAYLMPLDVYVFDHLGLANLVVSRVALDRRATPGHEKTLSSPWLAAAYVAGDATLPDGFATSHEMTRIVVGIDLPPDLDPAEFAAARLDAADALQCGELRDLTHNARAPLTFGRFVGNLADAVRLHDFRFPQDPAAARADLCR